MALDRDWWYERANPARSLHQPSAKTSHLDESAVLTSCSIRLGEIGQDNVRYEIEWTLEDGQPQ